MENDDVVHRRDGSVIENLPLSKWKEYLKKYVDTPEEELIRTRDISGPRVFDEHDFEYHAAYLNSRNKIANRFGKRASDANSLFMLLSVHVKPLRSSTLSVYGEITSVSGCKRDYISLDAQTSFGSDGGYLTLNGPSKSCSRNDACFLLGRRELSITLFDRAGERLLVDDPIILDYSPDDVEHVEDKVVPYTEILLTLKYVSIPMAVYGILSIGILNRFKEEVKSEVVKVCGKVVAKYKNTIGNYNSEAIVLFDKNPKFHQFEKVHLETGSNNLLSSSRCWVAAPAYASVQLRIDLSDSEENPIFNEDVELEIERSLKSTKTFVSGAYYISVSAIWCYPPLDPLEVDAGEYQIYRSLGLRAETLAIEVFSVLVWYKECTTLSIHGHLRVKSGTLEISSYSDVEGGDIFKREKEAPVSISGRGDIIPMLDGGDIVPLLDGCRIFDPYYPLLIICDLKDTTGNLNIKGYQIYRRFSYFERQLCSIFRGDHGFAALHYTIFPVAVRVKLKVFVYQLKGSECAVFGSICVRYNYLDYSSQYKKNCYRIVLLKDRENLVQNNDGSIQLSRYSFVVPCYYHPVLDLDLTFGTQKFSDVINVPIGALATGTKSEDCEVKFMLEWSGL